MDGTVSKNILQPLSSLFAGPLELFCFKDDVSEATNITAVDPEPEILAKTSV